MKASKQFRKARKNFFHILFHLFGIGHHNVDSFIIISQSRAGSSLLVSLLNSHPDILAKEEKMREIGTKSPEEVFTDFFTKKLPLNYRARGFKLFYYHPIDGKPEECLNALKQRKSIKIIHLKRRNTLRLLTSRKIALKTGNWKPYGVGNLSVDDKKVRFTKEELLSGFENNKRWEEKIIQTFNNQRVHDIFYEDLTANRKDTMEALFQFIGVEYCNTDTDLEKQNPEPLASLVHNYKLLKQEFLETEWQHYFE